MPSTPIATATQYPKRFEFDYTDTMLAQFRLWPDESLGQKEIVIYAELLATHLNCILNTTIPHFAFASTINAICKNWDYGMKRKMAKALAAIDDQLERARVYGMVMQTWVDFVDMMRDKAKKLRCRLCHERLEKVKDEQRADLGLVDHVTATHGPPGIWEELVVDEQLMGE